MKLVEFMKTWPDWIYGIMLLVLIWGFIDAALTAWHFICNRRFTNKKCNNFRCFKAETCSNSICFKKDKIN